MKRNKQEENEEEADPFLAKMLSTRILAPKKREGLPCGNIILHDESISVKFCEKILCEYYNRKKNQCRKRKSPIPHLDLRPHHTTLRNRGVSGGWHYRDV
jgi:hypothetical protein